MVAWLNSLALIASFVSLATTQSIDPSTVDIETREKWCVDQKASCPLLCLQINGTIVPTSNECTPSSLAFSCVCSNGLQPKASEYSQTIPYYECTTSNTQCVQNCAASDSSCAAACQADHKCGAQNPKRVNTSTMTTMEATSTGAFASGTAINTGFLGQATTSTNSAPKHAQSFTVDVGRLYGLLLMLGLVLGGFTIML